ncbi:MULTISPECIES: uracil-DNA glycosylase family protein [Nitrincola]|uniref:Uracil-DNA glycosylase-like domain-containing protein n=1 Tax=Nitrincola nitratireducens TaxID=1229521 RepID=W9UXK2_9GAMM|nr:MULTISPECIES: hypothetical protein [Nitrincola]EXJ11978.1 hypothetical protein D791_00860 [Nitrincola nitratireducens]
MTEPESEGMVAQESLRHTYLQAIGVQSWLPRGALPHAAPSAPWVETFTWPPTQRFEQWEDAFEDTSEVPAAEQPVLPVTPSVNAPRGVSRALESLQGMFAPEGTPSQKVLESTPPALSETTPSASALDMSYQPEPVAPLQNPLAERYPEPQFSLVLMTLGELLIVDSLPPQGRQSFSPAHIRFVSALARSLGVQGYDINPIHHHWPAFVGSALNQGPDEALRSVRRLLGNMLKSQEIKRVLLLGEASAQWILEQPEPLDSLRGLRFSLRAGVAAVSSHSVTALLRIPELKAELWADLQPLLATRT